MIELVDDALVRLRVYHLIVVFGDMTSSIYYYLLFKNKGRKKDVAELKNNMLTAAVKRNEMN